MGFTNGQAHIGEPIDQYHSRAEISASMVKLLLKSPEDFHWAHILKRPVKVSDSMDFGTAIHEDQLLAVWEQSWIEIPREALSSAGRRQGGAWEAFKREHSSKILLKSDQVEKLKYIRESIENNPLAVELLTARGESINEITITADAPLSDGTTQPVRGRIDKLSDCVIDFKSLSDLGDRTVQYRPFDHRWDVQAVMYQLLVQAIRGGSLPDVYFIGVETTVPYRCEVIHPSQQTLAAAALVLQDAIEEIVQRTKSGSWHRNGWPEPLEF
jgi:hypothetical protein